MIQTKGNGNFTSHAQTLSFPVGPPSRLMSYYDWLIFTSDLRRIIKNDNHVTHVNLLALEAKLNERLYFRKVKVFMLSKENFFSRQFHCTFSLV